MNASTETCAAGYEIYRYYIELLGDDFSRSDLNHRLDGIGREPISKRTFEHYGKLYRSGQLDYIPINKFDVNGHA